MIEIACDGCATGEKVDQVFGIGKSIRWHGGESAIPFAVVDTANVFGVEQGNVDIAVAVEVCGGNSGVANRIAAADIEDGWGGEGAVPIAQ